MTQSTSDESGAAKSAAEPADKPAETAARPGERAARGRRGEFRRKLGDRFIRWGLHLQIIFLLMVDWGTIEGMRQADEVSWVHVAGLIAVNVVLLSAAIVTLVWIHGAQKREAQERRPLGSLAPPRS